MFRIYPAVDIKGGRCVRLYQGDMEKETVFSRRPWKMALAWEKQGASYLHLVDLDGAAQDRPVNLEPIREILRRVRIPAQVGGGIRRVEDVETLFGMGASRVVVGTRAFEDGAFLEKLSAAFPGRILVSIDMRGTRLAVRGWREELGLPLEEVVGHLLDRGVERVIHTDISRDGTLEGHGAPALEYLLERGLRVIAAGGISSVEDVALLKGMAGRGLEGVIIGRALYEGRLSLSDVLPLQEE